MYQYCLELFHIFPPSLCLFHFSEKKKNHYSPCPHLYLCGLDYSCEVFTWCESKEREWFFLQEFILSDKKNVMDNPAGHNNSFHYLVMNYDFWHKNMPD